MRIATPAGMIRVDVAIVGAGMAGASLAAEIAPHATVLVIEGEAQPGYHATGRSAAFWSESYGGPLIQPLTRASHDFLAAPPPDFSDAGFLRDRGAVHVAEAGREAALDAFDAEYSGIGLTLTRLDRAALEARIPGIRAGWNEGLLEAGTSDIDVAALHAAYLRAARGRGGRLLLGAVLRSVERRDGRWRIRAGDETVDAALLVDAAGAWADDVARLAGAVPLGVRPYRRTVAQLRIDPPAPAALPLVIDASGRFYFKPDVAGRIWLSPHDETPAAAGDAAPEELDVASAVHRLGGVVDWSVVQVERAWAGLRSFAPDRLPVYGYDAACPGFFWFAGQGGFGIQTAPAAARIAAALLLRTGIGAADAAIDLDCYRPDRFTNGDQGFIGFGGLG